MKTAWPGKRTDAKRSLEERDRLIEQYLPLVQHVVSRLTIALPGSIERDDLVSAGVMGLIHAAETYDTERGATFKTYAYTVVRGAILDELRRQDPVPRSVRERIRKLEHTYRQLAADLRRSPTREELSARLDCSVSEVDESLTALHTAHVLSIDDTSGEHEPVSESVAVESRAPIEEAETKESIELLTRAIADLPEQAGQAVALYFHEGLLLKEIGTILGVSESRVSQVLSNALARLKLAMTIPSEAPQR